jgi:hypothetical protein
MPQRAIFVRDSRMDEIEKNMLAGFYRYCQNNFAFHPVAYGKS